VDSVVRQEFHEGIEYLTGSVLDGMHVEAALDHEERYVFLALRPTTANGSGTSRESSMKHQVAEDGTQHLHPSRGPDDQHEQADRDPILWEFDQVGLASAGDRVLVVSAALRHTQARIIGLAESGVPKRESE
jgi:hypothetical protein